MKLFIATFLTALFVCYGSDFVPYYVSWFSRGEMRVIGPLTNFATNCRGTSGSLICGSAYRIPRQILNNDRQPSYIGIGIIVQPVSMHCLDDDGHEKLLEGTDDPRRVSLFLRTYQTFQIDPSVCTGDLLIENWLSPDLVRHGYSQAPVTVGSRSWISRTKTLVEFFQTGIATICSFLLLIYGGSLILLQRSTRMIVNLTVFDDYIFHCLIVLNLGFMFDSFIPVSPPSHILVRLSNWCGFTLVSGIVLSSMSDNSKFPLVVRQVSHWFNKPVGKLSISLIGLFGVALFSSKFFAIFYAHSLIIFSLIGVLAAVYSADFILLAVALGATSDALKIFMIPNFPASRMTFVCITFIVIYKLSNYIRTLSDTVRSDAAMKFSAQLAHDIRSPVAVLNNLIPRLKGEDEVKQLVSAALGRIKEIASSFLDEYRNGIASVSNSEWHYLNQLVGQVVGEKNVALSRLGRSSINYAVDDSRYQVLVEPSALKRILSNLLDNAIEATSTDDGKVVVKITTTIDSVMIEISDNGHGFSAETTESLSRNVKLNSTKDGGYGLGLPYAKKVLEEWGGKLVVESKSNWGSRVTIVLKRR